MINSPNQHSSIHPYFQASIHLSIHTSRHPGIQNLTYDLLLMVSFSANTEATASSRNITSMCFIIFVSGSDVLGSDTTGWTMFARADSGDWDARTSCFIYYLAIVYLHTGCPQNAEISNVELLLWVILSMAWVSEDTALKRNNKESDTRGVETCIGVFAIHAIEGYLEFLHT